MRNFNHYASAAFFGLSLLSAPLVANEYSTKGAYFTGSIGGSAIGDIDVSGITSDIEFDPGLGLDLGFGYDFGKTRIEANWVRGQSDKTSWLLSSQKGISQFLIGSKIVRLSYKAPINASVASA